MVPAYLVATLAITWPLAREFRVALPAVFNSIDPLLQAFILGWDRHALATGPFGVFDAPIFHPQHRTLAYMDHLLGEAVLSSPVLLATGSAAAAYNMLVVVSFVASGWATYRLARALGASRAAGFVGGLLFMQSPYRLSNLGNLNQLQTQLVPLGLLFTVRFAATGRARELAWMLALLALQSYFGWYYAFHLALVYAVALACGLAYRWPGAAPLPWKRIAWFGALALLVMLPGALPYWLEHGAMPGFTRRLGTAALYSADLLDYARVNRENALARALHLPRGDLAYAVGLVTFALAAVGLAARRAAPPWVARLGRFGAFLGWLAAAGFVLSLGPVLKMAGRMLPVPLPYAVLYFTVPGFSSMRAPGRFAELVVLVAVLFAVRGYDVIRARTRGATGRILLGSGIVTAALATAWSAPLPMVAYPGADTLPPVYRWIASQPGRFAILELPMPFRESEESERDAVRQIWLLYHGKARADGVSGFSSPAHEGFRALMRSFPDPLAVRAVAGRGVRFVIVRYGEYDRPEAARIAHEIVAVRELLPVHAEGSDVVYSLAPADLLAGLGPGSEDGRPESRASLRVSGRP